MSTKVDIDPVVQVDLEQMYAEVVDVVERTRRGIPLRVGALAPLHTSPEARAAALRIGELIEVYSDRVHSARG